MGLESNDQKVASRMRFWWRMKLSDLVWLCIIILVVPTSALSQVQDDKDRPKIGLALSGGGARGFAHIGVLEWIEEHRIPVDYIAGTSMGGLVSAMYAMGMTPDEMRRLVSGINWDEVFRNTRTYDHLGLRRKEDRRSYPNKVELGWRNGLKAPSGLVSEQAVVLLLSCLTLPYSAQTSFDDLPIPFRCVATDLVTADPVIIKDGDRSGSALVFQ